MKAVRPNAATGHPSVDVHLLQFRNAADTIRCGESVLATGYEPLRLIVVDNGSDDGAGDRVWTWMASLGRPAACLRYDHRARDERSMAHLVEAAAGTAEAQFVLIRSRLNRGYSGGMNLGLCFTHQVRPARFAWLLNNDLLVDSDALHELVSTCVVDATIGVCGSLQRRVDDVGRVTHRSVPGGFGYSRVFGVDWALRRSGTDLRDQRWVERHMFGVQGAAVFCARPLLERLHYLSEHSFIYYEEQDLAVRARAEGFRLAWAPRSVVRHNGGRTFEHRGKGRRSQVRPYLMARARLEFTRRTYPWALPTVFAAQIGRAVANSLLGRRAAIRAEMRGAWHGLTGRHAVFPELGDALLPGHATSGLHTGLFTRGRSALRPEKRPMVPQGVVPPDGERLAAPAPLSNEALGPLGTGATKR